MTKNAPSVALTGFIVTLVLWPLGARAKEVQLDLSINAVAREVEDGVKQEGLVHIAENLKDKPKQRGIVRLFAQLAGKTSLVKKLDRNLPFFAKRRRFLSARVGKNSLLVPLMRVNAQEGRHLYNIYMSSETKKEAEVVIAWHSKENLGSFNAQAVLFHGPGAINQPLGDCDAFYSYVLGVFDRQGRLLDVFPRYGVIKPSTAGRFNSSDTWRCFDSYVVHDPSK